MKTTSRKRTWTRHIRWSRSWEGYQISYNILKRDILFGRNQGEREAYTNIDYSTEVVPIPEGMDEHEDSQ